MDRMPEEVVKLAESVEVKQKTTKPQEVASTVHKGSYPQLWEVFGKLAQGIEENGYEIVSSSIIVCYNDPHTTSEEELADECQFLVRKGRWERCKRLIGGCFGEKKIQARGAYIRSIADISNLGDILFMIERREI